jgi:hypothetical protein
MYRGRVRRERAAHDERISMLDLKILNGLSFLFQLFEERLYEQSTPLQYM